MQKRGKPGNSGESQTSVGWGLSKTLRTQRDYPPWNTNPRQPSEKGCHGDRREARSPQQRPTEQQVHEHRRRHYQRGQDLSDPWRRQNTRQDGTRPQESHRYQLISCPLSLQGTRTWGQLVAAQVGGDSLEPRIWWEEEGAGFHPAGSCQSAQEN